MVIIVVMPLARPDGPRNRVDLAPSPDFGFGGDRRFRPGLFRGGLPGRLGRGRGRLDGRYRPGRRAWIKIKPRSGSLDGMTC